MDWPALNSLIDGGYGWGVRGGKGRVGEGGGSCAAGSPLALAEIFTVEFHGVYSRLRHVSRDFHCLYAKTR